MTVETMTVEALAARAMKPKPGEQCNRCGLCCLLEQCPISVEVFGHQPRCPALEHAGSLYACGLITNAARHLGLSEKAGARASLLIGEALGVGTECDSIEAGEESPETDAMLEQWNAVKRGPAR